MCAPTNYTKRNKIFMKKTFQNQTVDVLNLTNQQKHSGTAKNHPTINFKKIQFGGIFCVKELHKISSIVLGIG